MPTPKFDDFIKSNQEFTTKSVKSTHDKRVTIETIENISGSLYTILGTQVTASGIKPDFKIGDVVSVAWKNNKPYIILGHSWRRARTFIPVVPTGKVLEVLWLGPVKNPDGSFLLNEGIKVIEEIWIQNATIFTSLNIASIYRSNSDTVQSVKWGFNPNTFAVYTFNFATNAKKFYIFKLNRNTTDIQGNRRYIVTLIKIVVVSNIIIYNEFEDSSNSVDTINITINFTPINSLQEDIPGVSFGFDLITSINDPTTNQVFSTNTVNPINVKDTFTDYRLTSSLEIILFSGIDGHFHIVNTDTNAILASSGSQFGNSTSAVGTIINFITSNLEEDIHYHALPSNITFLIQAGSNPNFIFFEPGGSSGLPNIFSFSLSYTSTNGFISNSFILDSYSFLPAPSSFNEIISNTSILSTGIVPSLGLGFILEGDAGDYNPIGNTSGNQGLMTNTVTTKSLGNLTGGNGSYTLQQMFPLYCKSITDMKIALSISHSDNDGVPGGGLFIVNQSGGLIKIIHNLTSNKSYQVLTGNKHHVVYLEQDFVTNVSVLKIATVDTGETISIIDNNHVNYLDIHTRIAGSIGMNTDHLFFDPNPTSDPLITDFTATGRKFIKAWNFTQPKVPTLQFTTLSSFPTEDKQLISQKQLADLPFNAIDEDFNTILIIQDYHVINNQLILSKLRRFEVS